MQTVSKTIYRTSDNKEFDDEIKASTHEAGLQMRDYVRTFVEIQYPDMGDKGKTRKVNELLQYEGYRLMKSSTKVQAA